MSLKGYKDGMFDGVDDGVLEGVHQTTHTHNDQNCEAKERESQESPGEEGGKAG